MDKQEYLTSIFNDIEYYLSQNKFRYDLAQVRAKAIQTELVSSKKTTDFRFDEKEIWNIADFLLSDSSLLMREKFGDQAKLNNAINTAATIFEFLAKFSDPLEKVMLLLNSAICYHISGYQANGQCIIKQIEKELTREDLDVPDNYDRILVINFRKSIVEFLKRNVSKLRVLANSALDSVNRIEEPLINELKTDNSSICGLFDLTGHALFQSSMREIAEFCISGKKEHLEKSVSDLTKSHEYFVNLSDVTFATITLSLLSVIDALSKRNTWNVVADNAKDLLNCIEWKNYLRNIALDKSIVEFWPSQISAINAGVLTSNDSFIIQMPTSAGKTLIAEITILAELCKKNASRCLYVAPYRALVNEVELTFAQTLGSIGLRISNLIGGFELDSMQNFMIKESDVVIATPEKVDLFLRTNPDYFDNLSVVVIDEGHIIDEGIGNDQWGVTDASQEIFTQGTLGRGVLLEILITRLKILHPEIRFIFLSAVMPTISSGILSEWLSKGGQGPLGIKTRPSRQVIGQFTWLSDKNGQIEYININRLPDGSFPFVPFFISKKKYLSGELDKRGNPKRISWPKIKNKAQTTSLLATQFAKIGPVLIFCAQPRDVKYVVENLIKTLQLLHLNDELPTEDLKYEETPDLESYHLALKWLGRDHPLTRGLQFSVGLHYGPLPEPVRQAVEDDYKNRKINILVSTNTLGQGVNLPIKTAIIYSLVRRWGIGSDYEAKITKRDFWNICGRAGRAGKETEGQVIFVNLSNTDKSLLAEFSDRENVEPVNSSLYKLLLLLTKNRISDDQLLDYLDSHVLALMVEEVIGSTDEEAIRKFLGHSLVGVQAIKNNLDIGPLVRAIQNSATRINDTVPDLGKRKIYSTTGLGVASCQLLEEGVEKFLGIYAERGYPTNQLICDYDLLKVAFDYCKNINEMMLNRRINYFGPQNEYDLLSMWVEGKPVDELRLRLWTNPDSDNFSQYLSDRIMYKLPWGLNAFIRILSGELGDSYEDLPLSWQNLSSMVKYGLDNVYACWASSLGVPSRELSLQIASIYKPEEGREKSFSEFIKWLTSLSTEFILESFDVSRFEKIRFIQILARFLVDNEGSDFLIEEGKDLVISIRGIPYEGRETIASMVSRGDILSIEPEPENLYDPNAIRILYQNQILGYVPREKSAILQRELKAGTPIHITVGEVRPPNEFYQYHSINAHIHLDEI